VKCKERKWLFEGILEGKEKVDEEAMLRRCFTSFLTRE
jgi:hypothetical protein